MKKTLRILSLVLCLAMLVGIFATSAFAVEPTYIVREDFTDLSKFESLSGKPAYSLVTPEVEEEEEEIPAKPEPTKVLVLTGAKNESKHEARLEYSFGADLATSQLAWDKTTPDGTGENEGKYTSNDGRWYARNKIWGIEYKFDAKIDGANMGVTMYQSFYGINNGYTPADQGGRFGNLLITAEGKIYKALTNAEPAEADLVGQIDTTKYDLSQWHTYTFRWVRTSPYAGDYYLYLYIDGEFVAYNDGVSVKSTNGGTKDYFAIKVHNTEGTVAVDNISVNQTVYTHNGVADTNNPDRTPNNIAISKSKEIMTEDFTSGTWGEGWFKSTSEGASAEVVDSLAGGEEIATESQHVKLNHAAADGQRAYIGAALATKDGEDTTGLKYARGKFAAKDLTFEAKITDGADMMIEFYVIWDLLNAEGAIEESPRRVTVTIADGVITNTTTGTAVAMGTVPSSIDMSQWHTYTVRVSRQSGYAGTYDVQLLIDGIAIGYEGESKMDTQGSPAYERFAIHARSAGSIEIDNIKVEEMYLDAKMGAVTADSVVTTFTANFDDPSALVYTADGYVPGEWKKAAHPNTEVTFVADAAADEEEEEEEEELPEEPVDMSGYLSVTAPSSGTQYAIRVFDTGKTPMANGTVHWLSVDARVNGGGISIQVGSTTKAGAGRMTYMQIRADGVYYKTSTAETKVCDLVNGSEWNNYMVKVDPSTNKGTLYINGVNKGEIELYMYPYNAESDNFHAVKMYVASSWGLTGSVDVDNIMVTTGAAPIEAPGATADASIIGLAAMMLPVSGIGLGALCLKRKKEN